MVDSGKSWKSKTISPWTLIAFSAAGVLLGLGLCDGWIRLPGNASFYYIAGSIGLTVSAVLLFISVIWAIGTLWEATGWAPWRGRTGLAKAAAILATALTISLGLCGANFLAISRFGR